jgi:ketosteroid isomerase-like protein
MGGHTRKEGDIVARTAAEILQHHLDALKAQDIDAIASDYGENSVLLTPDGATRGLAAITDFFTDALKGAPGLTDAITINRQEIEGDLAYIVWDAPGFFSIGTDTFLVRDDKIAVQTFAAYSAG